MAAYTLLKHPLNEESAMTGDTVYDLIEGETGLAQGDTRMEGIEYTFVTLQEDGSSPGFSAPSADLKLLY